MSDEKVSSKHRPNPQLRVPQRLAKQFLILPRAQLQVVLMVRQLKPGSHLQNG